MSTSSPGPSQLNLLKTEGYLATELQSVNAAEVRKGLEALL